MALLFVLACGKGEEPAGASITVGGTRYPITNAVVRGTHVALSTGALDCAHVAPDAQLMLSHGELGWTLGGTLFPRIYTAKNDAMTSAKIEVSGRTVTLGGRTTIGGNVIDLAGSIAAVECPE